MANHQYELKGQDLARANGTNRLATFAVETATGKSVDDVKREGGLAYTLKPYGGAKKQIIDVRQDYQWTLSSKKDWQQYEEVPYVHIKEYKIVDGSIKRQLAFYMQLVPDIAGRVAGGLTMGNKLPNMASISYDESLDVYTDIWPKDNATGFEYIFPYFQKTGMELRTQSWTSMGTLGDSIKNIAEGGAKVLGGAGAKAMADLAGKGLDLLEAGSSAIMNWNYPTVNVTDRPRVFMGHDDRSIKINFTLYNTVGPDDWQDNRNLAYLLMSQNLFNKRDLTTGVPPVFYDVFIPGQYFSYASCLTDLTVDYLGNQRLMFGEYIVPDAYEISMTLTELVKPSKNQFEAVQSGAARNYVNTKPLATSNLGENVVQYFKQVAGMMGGSTDTNEENQSVKASSLAPSPAVNSTGRSRGGRINSSAPGTYKGPNGPVEG
jgi:hypothetical protein